MSYLLNDDVLWFNRVGVHEYRFAALAIGVGATWDPDNSTGVLTNDGRSVQDGQNFVVNDWAAPLPSYPGVEVAWIAELTIDRVNSAMLVGVWRGAGEYPPDSSSTCYWSAQGYSVINYSQGAGGIGSTNPPDPAWMWTTNDKLGIAVVGSTGSAQNCHVWFFKNGVLLGQGVIQYYAGPPWRVWARATGGQITLNCDLASMTFATDYVNAIPTVVGWQPVRPATRLIVEPNSLNTIADTPSASFVVRADFTLGAAVTVTLTSDKPSDVINPPSLTLSTSTLSGSFQVTGSVLGEHAITLTNDGGLENPDPLTVMIEEPPTATPLASGETISVSGAAGTQQYFSIVVPAGQAALTIRATSGTGDADLYVNRDQYPTTTSYLDASQLPGKTNETITESDPEAGTWIVLVYGHAAFADASLTLTITS